MKRRILACIMAIMLMIPVYPAVFAYASPLSIKPNFQSGGSYPLKFYPIFEFSTGVYLTSKVNGNTVLENCGPTNSWEYRVDTPGDYYFEITIVDPNDSSNILMRNYDIKLGQNGNDTPIEPPDDTTPELPGDTTTQPPSEGGKAEINFNGLPGDGGYTNSNVNYAIDLKSCELTSLEVYKNGYSSYGNYGLTGTISQEGSYRIEVNAVDESGKTINEKRSFTIDKTSPRISYNGFTSIKDVVNYDVDPYISFSEDGKLYYTVNGNQNVYNIQGYSNVDLPAITEEGTYNISFYAEDYAGNRSGIYSKKITVRKSGPVITVQGVSEGGTYKEITPVISIDGAEKYEMYLDYSYNSIKSGQTINKDGDHTLYVNAYDSLWNKSQFKVSFKIDNTPPKLSDIYPDRYTNDFSSTAPIQLTFDSEIDLSSINSQNIQLKNIDTGRNEQFDFSKTRQKKSSWSNIVYVYPANRLKASSNYKLNISSRNIRDIVGNKMEGSDYSIDFKTRKFYDAPVVKETNLDNVISNTDSIVVKFKDSIPEELVNSKLISLTNMSTGNNETCDISVDDNTLYIRPEAGLSENTQYQLTIDKNAILSYDSVPMNESYVKGFKTAELFRIVSKDPEGSCNEKRPGIRITFTNPINKNCVNDSYFSLIEDDNSNKNDYVDCSFRTENDGKTVVMIPQTSLSNNGRYKVVVNSTIKDIYNHMLDVENDVEFGFDVDAITSILKPTGIKWEQNSFRSVKLSFIDNSQGEEGYSIRVNGDDEQYFIESVKGYGSVVEYSVYFDEPSAANSITIAPVVDDEEDSDNLVDIDNVKLELKKPAKAAEIKAKLLSDGSIKWTWKDVPADFNGESAYILFRKDRYGNAVASKSSEGEFVEKVDYTKEKIINNSIIRYVSRGVNIEGQNGKPLESDMVKYVIKLPDRPPKASIRQQEYNNEEGTLNIKWSVVDIKGIATKFEIQLIDKDTNEISNSEDISAEKGKSDYEASFYANLNSEHHYQVIVITKNSFDKETSSKARDVIFIGNDVQH